MEPTIFDPHWIAEWGTYWDKKVLFGDSERDRFEIEVFVPSRERLTLGVANSHLRAIEQRLHLALAYTFLASERLASLKSFRDVLREVHRGRRDIPLAISDIGLGSIKLKVSGDATEIAEYFGRKEPPRDWKRKLLGWIGALFMGAAMGAGAVLWVEGHPVPFPTSAEIGKEANRACGELPAGTVVKVKAGIVEAEFHCGPPSPKSDSDEGG